MPFTDRFGLPVRCAGEAAAAAYIEAVDPLRRRAALPPCSPHVRPRRGVAGSASLPDFDRRTPEEILGYAKDGLPS